MWSSPPVTDTKMRSRCACFVADAVTAPKTVVDPVVASSSRPPALFLSTRFWDTVGAVPSSAEALLGQRSAFEKGDGEVPEGLCHRCDRGDQVIELVSSRGRDGQVGRRPDSRPPGFGHVNPHRVLRGVHGGLAARGPADNAVVPQALVGLVFFETGAGGVDRAILRDCLVPPHD